jgi:hypothetical protein
LLSCAGRARGRLKLRSAWRRPWQSRGVGTALLRRTLLTARNRGYRLLHMACLADNRRMQRIARKFDAERSFDFGSVVGEVEPWRANPLSMMQEFMADGHGFATAMLDLQSRMLWASLYPPFLAEFAALNETWPGVALDHERLVA